MARKLAKFEDFLFPAVSDLWLTILRVGLGIQVVLYCLSLRSDWNRFFAQEGLAPVSRQLAEAMIRMQSPVIPRLGWIVDAVSRLGGTEQLALTIAWYTLLIAGFCLIIGVFARSAAIAAWFLQLSAAMSGNLFSYGVDNVTTTGLFYLMISPLPDRLALDRQIRGAHLKDPHLHGFFRRILQLHLCFIYFFSGLSKSIGAGWWNGMSLWRSFTSPPFNAISPGVLVWLKWLLPPAGVGVFLLELSYVVLIWPAKTQKFCLAAILLMHILIGLVMGLYLFSLVMIVLNLAAFGSQICYRREGN